MVREHKNRPTEISSKQPVSVLREVIPSAKKKAIDPRFDRAFGHFNDDLFGKTYGFLGDMQKNEVQMLRSQMQKETDSRKKEALRNTLNRITSMKRTKEITAERQAIVREHRKMESKMVEEGKTPYYLKRKDLKNLSVAKEFERVKDRIKDDAALERFIEKKRKKKASKQRRLIPNAPPTHRDEE